MLLRIGHRIINTDQIIEIQMRAGHTRVLMAVPEANLSGPLHPYEIRLSGVDAATLSEWLDLAATDLTLERGAT